MKYTSLILVALLIVALVVGCGSKGSKLQDTNTTHSGLEIRDLVVGTGASPDEDDTVSVLYTGWLTSGWLIESSAGGEPLQFDMGVGQVIPGWEEGISGMSVGGKRRLVIPPQLAYGSEGNPSLGIPGNATLVYEIELVEVQRVDWVTSPSGLKYRDLTVENSPTPQPGQTCYVYYTGWLEDGTKFDENQPPNDPWSFVIARGNVIAGWDEGVFSMTVGSKRKMIIPPDLAYGAEGRGVIPPNATLIFEVHLFDIGEIVP